MKNTLRNLSTAFLILLSACSISNPQEVISTIAPIPTALSTKTPTEVVEIAMPTATMILQTPTKDDFAPLSKLLPNCLGHKTLSPNQTWAVGFCNNDETWIVAADQTAKWTISYGEYYGRKVDSGNGSIDPIYWTLDNKYLYLTIQRGVSGPIYFANGWGLISLDLANGNITEILSPLPHQYYAFSLSPDGKSLAYIVQPAKPLTVSIMNLETGSVTSDNLMPQYNQAGEILWSPDMSKIVLGQAIIDVEETKPNLFSVMVINLAANSEQVIISDSSMQMTSQKWIDQNKIELSDEDGKIWVFNLADETLVEEPQ